MNRRHIEIPIHLLFWLFTAGLIASSFSIQSQEINIENGVETIQVVRDTGIIRHILIHCIIAMAVFYLNLANLLRLNHGRPFTWVAMRSVLLLISGLLLSIVLENVLQNFGHLPLPSTISWGSIVFYYTVSLAYGIVRVWWHTESQRRQLIIEKQEAELSLLRSQLHPHFLFNALNNLLAMVDQEQNPVLTQSLDRLSALLRYVVYDTSDRQVPVQKEIDFIRNFAELHALRFEPQELDFQLQIVGDHTSQLVEPGIFVPFVENAFKYGVEPEKESQITIRFELNEATRIKFFCQNPIHPVLQQAGKGSGIRSAKDRLELVYPGRHELTITKEKYFSVTLEINTNERNYR